MQHYGAPTRLLDFTYSPCIALYFALRDREKNESNYAEVWGIDAAILQGTALRTNREADAKVLQDNDETKSHRVSSRPVDSSSALQQFRNEVLESERLTSGALAPCGVRRDHFNKSGFVTLALPPLHNPRLSSQQGVFLFNGAGGSTFEVSLENMMMDVKQEWYKRSRIPKDALRGIEKQLFQLNIHELSLFPDIQGLAGFVRQKMRIEW